MVREREGRVDVSGFCHKKMFTTLTYVTSFWSLVLRRFTATSTSPTCGFISTSVNNMCMALSMQVTYIATRREMTSSDTAYVAIKQKAPWSAA